MRAVIIANGELNHPLTLEQGDMLIAANGGAQYCLAAGVLPEVVIGDLDSLDARSMEKLEHAGVKLIRHPQRKDYTDLELALRYALEANVDDILLLGVLGNRWDQTIANLMMLASIPYPPIRMLDGAQEIRVIHAGEEALIQGKRGDIVSLIPLRGEAQGITTQNLEYPLRGESLTFGSTRGISNVMLNKQAKVYLSEGMLLCTIIHT